MEIHRTLPPKPLLAACVFLLLSGAVFTLESQDEQEIREILSTCMDQVREHYTDRECDQFDRMCREYGPAMVSYVEEYVADPCSRVRWHAYVLLWRMGLDANDLQVRQKIVTGLLMGVRDDAYNTGHLSHWLLQFSSADFSEPSRELVREMLVRALADANTNPREDIILLAGVADLKSELPRLKRFMDAREVILKERNEKHVQEWREAIGRLPDTNNMPAFLPRRKRYEKQLMKQYWQSSLLWAALRARARMGVKEDIARCIELVESHPDEDYRVAWLLEELSYVRQPEIVDYLYRYLKSEKVRESKGPDTVVGTYAQHAAKALAQMLRGFPGRKDIGGDKETIELRRKWMAEQKDWDIIR
ncbi:MAG TPA: hypothetical protein VMX13_14935 [Sedimentisphaerales bacterium]|nr:hypothetical protein [Sedimentisphaerales bacterium]